MDWFVRNSCGNQLNIDWRLVHLNTNTFRVDSADWVPSPNHDERPDSSDPEVVIVHCISLPPGEYGGGEVKRFFQNQLSADEHPYFQSMAHLCVSSHFLIDRKGELTQFVTTDKRAWHAGESVCLQRSQVNNFSIGIELEGWDLDKSGFTSHQYQSLAELIVCLRQAYPKIKSDHLFAHSDISPGRKPDPGPYFEWTTLFRILDKMSI